MYEIEWSRESREATKCVRKELREPFHRFELPHNATFLGEGTIGTNAFPGLGVNVAAFKGMVGDGKPNRYFIIIVVVASIIIIAIVIVIIIKVIILLLLLLLLLLSSPLSSSLSL